MRSGIAFLFLTELTEPVCNGDPLDLFDVFNVIVYGSNVHKPHSEVCGTKEAKDECCKCNSESH